jgi:adenylate cyclase
VRPDLRRFLLDAGASEDDVDRSLREGWLPLLALDRLVTPGRPRHDLAAVAALTGADEEHVRRLWRAVGFPDVPDGLAVFNDADVEAARLVLRGRFARRSDFETVLRQVRVISASMARVAAVLAESFGDEIRDLRAAGVDDETVAWTVVNEFAADELAALLVYATRLQLRAALWRRLSRDAVPDLAVAIGFADLAGYTQLAARLDPDELAAFVGRWDELAYDSVAQHGGRVVKTIGDEVMFAGLPAQVARTAIALRDAAQAHGLPAVRAGLAAGMVVTRDGDVYGPVVNLASRLTEIAPAGAIYASDALHAELAGDASYTWAPLGTRTLRSIGPAEVFSLLGDAGAADRRLGERA